MTHNTKPLNEAQQEISDLLVEVEGVMNALDELSDILSRLGMFGTIPSELADMGSALRTRWEPVQVRFIKAEI